MKQPFRGKHDLAGFLLRLGGVDVTALENSSNSMPYLLRTNAGAIEASNVVIATGQREKGVIPPFSSDVPNDIRQLHSSAYRNAGELPPGAVLVVGSGEWVGHGIT